MFWDSLHEENEEEIIILSRQANVILIYQIIHVVLKVVQMKFGYLNIVNK